MRPHFAVQLLYEKPGEQETMTRKVLDRMSKTGDKEEVEQKNPR